MVAGAVTLTGRSGVPPLTVAGLVGLGATAGVITGRVIDVADQDRAGAGVDGANGNGGNRGAPGSSSSSATPTSRTAPGAQLGPEVRPEIIGPGESGSLRMAYGSDPRQFGDLHLPPASSGGYSRPVPLVVMIHGGGWMGSSSLSGASGQVEDLGRVAVTDVSANGSLAAWAANREARADVAPGANPVFPIRTCVAMCGA